MSHYLAADEVAGGRVTQLSGFLALCSHFFVAHSDSTSCSDVPSQVPEPSAPPKHDQRPTWMSDLRQEIDEISSLSVDAANTRATEENASGERKVQAANEEFAYALANLHEMEKKILLWVPAHPLLVELRTFMIKEIANSIAHLPAPITWTPYKDGADWRTKKLTNLKESLRFFNEDVDRDLERYRRAKDRANLLRATVMLLREEGR